MKSKIRSIFAFIALVVATPLWAQLPDAALSVPFALTDPLPPDPDVLTGQFENGLRYYVRANKKPEQRAELRLVVNIGSIVEDDDQLGLAHFVEHMAFNGTKNFEKQALVQYLESIGMEFGPDLNASTGFDATTYRLTVPTDNPEFIQNGLQILEDWAHQMTLADQDIDRERGVIIEEWRARRSAAARLRDKQYPTLYYNSRYAERLPIGKPEIIESASYDTLRRFYRDWYRPDVMAVIAVGDFDPQTMRDLIAHHFAGLTPPAALRPHIIYPVPDHDEFLMAIDTDPELTATSAYIYFKRDRQIERTVADYRQSLLENMYHLMLNQRLDELTKQANPPFLRAYSGTMRMVQSKDTYVLGVDLKDEAIPRGVETLLIEAERVRRHGFTPSEFERTQKLFLRQIERWYQERDKQESAVFVQDYLNHFLYDVSMPSIETEFHLFQQLVPEVRLDEINQLSHTWMTPHNRVLLFRGPEKAGLVIPTADDFRQMFAAVAQQDVQPYAEAVSDAPLVAQPPTPGTLVAETRIEALDVTEWTLSNGVRVVLKPTDFKNDEIVFSAFSPGGHSLLPDDEYMSAAWASNLIRESGVGAFSKIVLEKKLADKVARVAPGLTGLTETFSGSGSPKDLATIFQLIYLYCTAPRLDDEAVTAYLSRMKEDLKNRRAEPLQVFYDTIQTTMAQGHVRARPLTPELLDEIQPERSLAIYKDRFADASDFTFFFVGNFTLDGIKPVILTYLGGLPALHRQETWRDVGIEPPTGVVEHVVKKGIEPKSQVILIFTGDYTWSRQTNYNLTALMDALDIRLRETIREDKSGTYDVGVDLGLTRFPEQAYELTIGFGCDPQRVEELTTAVLAEIKRFQTTPLEETYLTRVTQTNLRTYETNLKQNGYWMNALWSAYYYAENPVEVILDYPKRVAAVTAETIQQTAQQYFNMQNYARFVLYPEGQAQPK